MDAPGGSTWSTHYTFNEIGSVVRFLYPFLLHVHLTPNLHAWKRWGRGGGQGQITKQEIHLFICWRKKNHVPLRLIGGCLSGRTSKINNTLFYCWLFYKDNKLSNFSTAAKSLKVFYPVTMAHFFSILWGVAAHKFCVALLQPVKTIFGPGGREGCALCIKEH